MSHIQDNFTLMKGSWTISYAVKHFFKLNELDECWDKLRGAKNTRDDHVELRVTAQVSQTPYIFTNKFKENAKYYHRETS
jgi:hypothetical protein